jgi:hypothetical protein
LFPAVDIDHFVLSVLHVLLGHGNCIYDNLIAELQAGYEVFSDAHVELEKALREKELEFAQAKEERKRHEQCRGTHFKCLNVSRFWISTHSATTALLTTFCHCVSYLQAQLAKPMDRRDEDNCTDDFLSGEKADVQETKKEDESDCQKAKTERDEAKQDFAKEESLAENSKATGQPLRFAIEQILKDKGGIDFAEFHGRAMQGPACRSLMGKRDAIFAEIVRHVIDLAPESKNEPDDNVTIAMLDVHRRLLGHVDACISFLKSERFTVDKDGVEHEQAEAHRDRFVNLWRHLGISETPKFHLGYAHAVAMFKKTGGFAEMGEDAVERGHQSGARAERRVGAMPDLVKKAKSIISYEGMEKHPRVNQKKEEILAETKRKFTKTRESAEDRSEKAGQERAEQRKALLEFPLEVGQMETLRDRKRIRIELALRL